jgi:methylglutaconyl-CoA hydratase
MIKKEVRGASGLITLDRPEKRNAFNPQLIRELTEAFVEFNTDDSIRAILLCANGEAFSAGADLKYLQSLQNNSLEENQEDSRGLSELFEAIYHSPKLTYSFVDGYALAGGCGLATLTDFCIATSASKFGYTEVKIGFIPALVMVYLRYKLKATDLNQLLLTGQIVSADEALKMGLISKVIEEAWNVEEMITYINKAIASNSGQSIASSKALLRSLQADHSDAIEKAIKANAEARSTSDCKRGIQAFLNKEKIDWT